MKNLKITIFADPVCTWCWGSVPVVRALEYRLGDKVEINYVMGNGVNKTVVYFLANFQDQLPKRYKDYEEFEYLLISFNEAYQMLAFDGMKKMLKSANDFLVMDI